MKADFDYINRTYGLSVKKGSRVEYTGGKEPKQGTVTSAYGPYLMIRLDGERRVNNYHPTWELKIL